MKLTLLTIHALLSPDASYVHTLILVRNSLLLVMNYKSPRCTNIQGYVPITMYLRGADFVECYKHKGLYEAAEGEVPVQPEG